MADEQIINLGPEEDLTNVRERLRQVKARRIILVVPSQTQLRSHVSWRVLFGDAQTLNKEVLVISSDRQIQSVVKSVGFRIVNAPYTSSSGRSRSSNTGRMSSRSRTPVTPSSRNTAPVSARERRPNQRNSRPLRPRYSPTQPSEQQKAEPDFQIDDLGTGGATAPLSSTFEMPDKQFGPDFNYSVGSTSPVRMVTPEPENVDEAYELLSRDHEQAQSIWEAAGSQPRNQDTLVSPPGPDSKIVPETPFRSRSFKDDSDPFSSMADDDTALPPHRTEQRANASVEDTFGFASNTPGYSSSIQYLDGIVAEDGEQVVGEVVDQGDLGDFVQRSYSPDVVQGTYEEEDDTPEPLVSPPYLDRRTHTDLPDRTSPPFSAPDEESEGTAELVHNQSTRHTLPKRPTRQSRYSKSPTRAGARDNEPRSIEMPLANMVSPGTAPLRPREGHRPSLSKAPARPSARSRRRRKQQGASKGWASSFLVLVLLVLIAVILGYTVPSANVTVTLASTTSKSIAMTFTATATNPLNVTKHTLSAELLPYNTSVQGKGQATGKTTVGTVSARGTETFTNNGTQAVHIPTGTVIQTSGGIQFATTADALVLTGNNNTYLIPIQATAPGTNGNVGTHTITVIPSSSTSALQRINNGEQINLSITNASATTGGGTGTAVVVSKQDVSKEQSVLAIPLQNGIHDFLSQKLHTGDQVGKPVLSESSVVTPPVGTIVDNGNFNMKVNLHMTVLVVRANEIQDVAAQTINAMLKQQKPGYALVPQQTLQITDLKNASSSGGKSLKLSFNAQGQIAPQIAVASIRAAISGKSISDARVALLHGQDEFTQMKQVTIAVSPSFFPKVPYMQQHIAVHFRTLPSIRTTAPTPKKTK
jgi:hypothetical protein